MEILVVDIGGTNVKVRRSGQEAPIRIPSGSTMTPDTMMEQIAAEITGWTHDVVAIGYPGIVRDGAPVAEPQNLGPGWVGFDFAAAFGRPVRLVNDAAMQALGGYAGGRMLYLGVGTGLGSALMVEGVLQPLELAHLPYRKGRTFEEEVGREGRERLGKKKWRRRVIDVVHRLATAMQADSVLLGGGEAKRLASRIDKLPPGTRIGSNEDAFTGGLRMWETAQAP